MNAPTLTAMCVATVLYPAGLFLLLRWHGKTYAETLRILKGK